MTFAICAILLFFLILQVSIVFLPLIFLLPFLFMLRRPRIQVYSKTFVPMDNSSRNTTRARSSHADNIVDGEWTEHN